MLGIKLLWLRFWWKIHYISKVWGYKYFIYVCMYAWFIYVFIYFLLTKAAFVLLKIQYNCEILLQF